LTTVVFIDNRGVARSGVGFVQLAVLAARAESTQTAQ
jgi:hypothetical protein